MLCYGFRAGKHYLSLKEPLRRVIPIFPPREYERCLYFRKLLIEDNGVLPENIHVFYEGREIGVG